MMVVLRKSARVESPRCLEGGQLLELFLAFCTRRLE